MSKLTRVVIDDVERSQSSVWILGTNTPSKIGSLLCQLLRRKGKRYTKKTDRSLTDA